MACDLIRAYQQTWTIILKTFAAVFCLPSFKRKMEILNRPGRSWDNENNERIISVSLVWISQPLDAWLRRNLLLYFSHRFDWHLVRHISLLVVSIHIRGQSRLLSICVICLKKFVKWDYMKTKWKRRRKRNEIK